MKLLHAIVLLGLACGFVLGCQKDPNKHSYHPLAENAPSYTPTPEPITYDCRESVMGTGNVCEILLGDVKTDIRGRELLTFNPSRLMFELGQTARIRLINVSDNESHSFTVEGLDIDEMLEPGETREIEILLKQRGSFTINCVFHTDVMGILNVG